MLVSSLLFKFASLLLPWFLTFGYFFYYKFRIFDFFFDTKWRFPLVSDNKNWNLRPCIWIETSIYFFLTKIDVSALVSDNKNWHLRPCIWMEMSIFWMNNYHNNSCKFKFRSWFMGYASITNNLTRVVQKWQIFGPR